MHLLDYVHITIDNCDVSCSFNAGVQWVVADWAGVAGILQNSTLTYNGCVDSYQINVAVDMKGADVTIQDNDINNNYQGLECDQTSSFTIVRRNKIYNNQYNGVIVNNADNNKIYYNLIYDNGSAAYYGVGINLFDSSSGTCTGNQIYNNVLYGNSQIGLYVQTEQTNLKIENNIFQHNFGYSPYTEIWLENGYTYSGLVIDYNLYYHEYDSGYWDAHCWYDGSTSYTFTGWQALGYDANSLNADPLMIDPANGDFTLQVGSPCIDAGVDVGLTTDYVGNTITQLPDIGAYEYQEENISRRKIRERLGIRIIDHIIQMLKHK